MIQIDFPLPFYKGKISIIFKSISNDCVFVFINIISGFMLYKYLYAYFVVDIFERFFPAVLLHLWYYTSWTVMVNICDIICTYILPLRKPCFDVYLHNKWYFSNETIAWYKIFSNEINQPLCIFNEIYCRIVYRYYFLFATCMLFFLDKYVLYVHKNCLSLFK